MYVPDLANSARNAIRSLTSLTRIDMSLFAILYVDGYERMSGASWNSLSFDVLVS